MSAAAVSSAAASSCSLIRKDTVARAGKILFALGATLYFAGSLYMQRQERRRKVILQQARANCKYFVDYYGVWGWESLTELLAPSFSATFKHTSTVKVVTNPAELIPNEQQTTVESTRRTDNLLQFKQLYLEDKSKQVRFTVVTKPHLMVPPVDKHCIKNANLLLNRYYVCPHAEPDRQLQFNFYCCALTGRIKRLECTSHVESIVPFDNHLNGLELSDDEHAGDDDQVFAEATTA